MLLSGCAWTTCINIERQSCCTVTHFRQRMGEGDGEGLSFVVAPDVTLQTVLAAKRLLTAITGTVERLLPYRMRTDSGGSISTGKS